MSTYYNVSSYYVCVWPRSVCTHSRTQQHAPPPNAYVYFTIASGCYDSKKKGGVDAMIPKKGGGEKNLRGAPALMHHFGVPVLFS